MNIKLPSILQRVLWSSDVNKLHTDTDKTYIIHQIFSHGRMKEIRWLFETYTKKDIIAVFTKTPYKDYDPARFYFVKNYLLHLKSSELNERLYVKNTPRDIR